jgi:glutathione S-transferase
MAGLRLSKRMSAAQHHAEFPKEMDMRLIGMLDSPYVRRTAISMRLMGLDFELAQISVFRGMEEFRRINPVLKVPTLLADDGTVLMDSTLILDFAQRLAGKSLMPSEDYARALRLIGLALAACEKSVQIYYERTLRPEEKRHQPWLDRVSGQLLAAYGALEREIGDWPSAPLQPDITVAVAWHFTRRTVPDVVSAAAHPRLAAYSAQAEIQPLFKEFAF